MMTVKQVSSLTGVSVRTLQFYDEIGLLKPTETTAAGYRLYGGGALEQLQQILFFKELDFPLKEIKAILESPQFDRAAAFVKQRELLMLKRDHLDGLLGLLDKLIKGETCMDFKEFDMSEYFQVLEDFKRTRTEDIVAQYGSIEKFEEMVSAMKAHEDEFADMAVKRYGSLESFTQAMKQSVSGLLDHGPAISQSEVGGLMEKTEELTRALTADLQRDPASPEVQAATEELIAFVNECSRGVDMGQNYWAMMAEHYGESPKAIEINDRKYGEGASRFMSLAIKAYLDRQ